MRYLRKTKWLPLKLEANSTSILTWSVDAPFATHPDMRSHTGGSFTLGKGTITGISRKQKLNTTSSTEAELVGVHDCMPQILWAMYWMKAQGYKVDDNIVLQDNMSTIQLENNGKRSSGRKTRHIEIRFFFVTDRIGKKDIRVEYCSTEKMVGDYFSKPLTGKLFYKFRNKIMNCEDGDPESWCDPPDLDKRSELGDKNSSAVAVPESSESTRR